MNSAPLSIDPKLIRNANLQKVPPEENEVDNLSAMIPWVSAHACVENCLANGYAPRGYLLADFCIVRTGGLWHLFHIPRVPDPAAWGGFPANEHWFGHAVSRDLDTWITLDPVLANDPSLPNETGHLWAPFVLEHEGTFYMFYAGVSEPVTGRLAWPESKRASLPISHEAQCLCMATSNDPELQRWTRHPSNPIHMRTEGLDWLRHNPDGTVHHMRDPHVVRVGSHFLMAYTAVHKQGRPVVGGLVSTDLIHWEDIGPIYSRSLRPDSWSHPESVNIQQLGDRRWVMLPSCGPGLEYLISEDPHDWHGSIRGLVDYADGNREQPAGIEVLRRHDMEGRWLVAWFDDKINRLNIGELDISANPWRLRRIRERSQLFDWQESAGLSK